MEKTSFITSTLTKTTTEDDGLYNIPFFSIRSEIASSSSSKYYIVSCQ